MNNAKNFKKVWMNSLSFLDNSIVQSVITIVLVLYCSTIFDNINSFIGNLYNFSIIKLIILLLIVYVSPKDITIAILLGLSYVISLSYMVNNEYFNEFQPKIGSTGSAGSAGYTENISVVITPGGKHGQPVSQPVIQNGMDQESESPRQAVPTTQTAQTTTPTTLAKEPQLPSARPPAPAAPPAAPAARPPTPLTTRPPLTARPPERFGNIMENFFPMQNTDVTSTYLNSNEHNNIDEEKYENINYDKTCHQNYVPMFESVGDVCSPTQTFKNEFNTQGLNFPEGYNNNIYGSSLN